MQKVIRSIKIGK